MSQKKFRTTANSCRKIAVENQNVMNRYDKYDTNFPSVKSLNQLKINGKGKNKRFVYDRNRHKTTQKHGLQVSPTICYDNQ